MAESLRILVVGATGQQGRALMDHLLARDPSHSVRVVTRDPDGKTAKRYSERGAEVVRGDQNQPGTIQEAARGVDVAFFLTTPYEEGPDAETRQGLNTVEAFVKAEVPHVVFSSVANADKDTGIPHFDSKRRIEEKLIGSGLMHTIVAPVFFNENLMRGHDDLAKGDLKVPLPGDIVLQTIGLPELGAFHAHAIEDHKHLNGKRIDVASGAVTPVQMAEAIERASRRKIDLHEVPLDAVRQQMGDDVVKMYEWFRDTGYSVQIERLHAEYPEIPWRTFADWATDQDWSFIPTDVAARH